MQLTLDMETRSRVDLTKCGVYRYAQDPSTEMLCIAVKVDDGLPLLWVHSRFRHLLDTLDATISNRQLQELVNKADTIIAHNAQFERVMWEMVMTRYGFTNIEAKKWKCTAAKAAAMALPRSLDGACEALGLKHQKDKEGRRIMLKMCKPRKATINNSAEWHENPEEFKRLCQYCGADVEAEYELDQVLPDLNEAESKLYQVDQTINSRGVYVDIKSINTLGCKIEQKERDLLTELDDITYGEVTSTRQRDATLVWLDGEGVPLSDLTKATVEKTLNEKRFLPTTARRVLEIRQSLSKSSVSKLTAMKRMANTDQRVRGTMLFDAASTGRWGGRGMQPHNYPRASLNSTDIDDVLAWDNDLIDMIHGDVFSAASKCLRGMICAASGKELLCADYSSIEARVLAWLAFETEVLNDFKEGLDAYKVAASSVFGTPYDSISSAQRFIGKTIVLACGYGGWVNAFRAMGNEDVNKLSDEDIGKNILKWRDSREKTITLWHKTYEAAQKAIETSRVYTYGLLSCGMRDGFLHIRLPSGRLLAYYQPRIEMLETPYGKMKETITYMGINSFTKKWERQSTFPGKIIENVVQAIARDVLAEALIRCEDSGYPVAFHVHDEIVSEVPKHSRRLSDFEKIVSVVPDWATGLPLKAEGWVGVRYRK